MLVRFVVLAPDAKKGSFAIRLPIIVGRSEEAKFRIQQDRVSRKHCEFFAVDGQVFIRDLGSTNGTFLEDEQVPTSAKVPVPPGGVVRVGSLVFRVDYEGATDEPATVFVPDGDDATLGAEAAEDGGDLAGFTLEPTEDVQEPPALESVAELDAAAAPDEPDAPEPAFPDMTAEAAPEAADLDEALAGLPAAADDAAPPDAEGFAFLESLNPSSNQAPGGKSGDDDIPWMPPDADAVEEAPDDDKLGDFFKGLQ